MQYEKLYEILSKVFPTCHTDWTGLEVPPYPYLAIVDEPSSNLSADNRVYVPIDNFTIELYAEKFAKEEFGNSETVTYREAEKKLEQALSESDIFYEKERVWLKDLKIYETIYNI